MSSISWMLGCKFDDLDKLLISWISLTVSSMSSMSWAVSSMSWIS